MNSYKPSYAFTLHARHSLDRGNFVNNEPCRRSIIACQCTIIPTDCHCLHACLIRVFVYGRSCSVDSRISTAVPSFVAASMVEATVEHRVVVFGIKLHQESLPFLDQLQPTS